MKKKVMILITSVMLAANMSLPVMAGQWKQDITGWYYEEDGGYPTNQWKEIDGKQYYFDGNGYMMHDTVTPDGYLVGSDGAWIPSVNKTLGDGLYEYCGTYFYNGSVDMFEVSQWEPTPDLQITISIENGVLFLTTPDLKKHELKNNHNTGGFISEQYGDSVWDAYRVSFENGRVYFSTEEYLIEYINCNSINYTSDYLALANNVYYYKEITDIPYLYELNVWEQNGVLEAYLGYWEGDGNGPSAEDFYFTLENGKTQYCDVRGNRSGELYDISISFIQDNVMVKVINKKSGAILVEAKFEN